MPILQKIKYFFLWIVMIPVIFGAWYFLLEDFLFSLSRFSADQAQAAILVLGAISLSLIIHLFTHLIMGILGLFGMLRVGNHLSLKNLIFTVGERGNYIKIVSYCFMLLYFYYIYDSICRESTYGVSFGSLAILGTALYTIWIVANMKSKTLLTPQVHT